MRGQLVSLTFAVLAILPPAIAAAPAVGEESIRESVPVAVHQPALVTGLREEAAMVLVGTALIVMASVVRRARLID